MNSVTILRPNCDSAPHWFYEAITWLNDAVGIKIHVRKKPIWMLWSFILDGNKESFPIGINSQYMFHKVRREFMYGPIVNENLDYTEEKVTELYKKFDPTKTYRDEEIYRIFYNWYLSINNAMLDIRPQ